MRRQERQENNLSPEKKVTKRPNLIFFVYICRKIGLFSPFSGIFMESIRININKQQGRDELIHVITYPTASSYDFHLRSCSDDMRNISTDKAYNIRIYPDGKNLQTSLIKVEQDGFIEYAILLNISHITIDGKKVVEQLEELAKAYETFAANDAKPSENKQFQAAVEAIHKNLSTDPQPGYPLPLKVAEKNMTTPLTFYMNYKTLGEIGTLLRYPDQEFFSLTSSIYLIPDTVHPAYPKNCKHIHSLVLRTFKIKSPTGYEYGQVKEGDTVRINLKGKEGMLPMTTDVRGEVTKPSPYGYFDTATNTIRIDERTIKFYYEVKFFVKYNGRLLRSCIVRYHGDQLMPDSNGCYLLKVYEDQVNDAGYIHFSCENMKSADIQLTPGIVKQQEYIYTPEPQHELTRVTLDFADGRPIEAMVDVGTNDRLFNQLNNGKVKGYKVTKDVDGFKLHIPRKLTKTSKFALRILKFLMMVALTLAAYAFAAWLFNGKWPWPITQVTNPTVKHVKQKQKVDDEGKVTMVDQPEEDAGLIINDNEDQFDLEEEDRDYLRYNDVWRKDSLKSSKYKDIISTIYNGNISEMKMRKINSDVIDNHHWTQIWRNIIVPNNIPKDIAKKIFEDLIKDHNTLDVQHLSEELEKNTLPSSDALKDTGAPTFPTSSTPSNTPPVVK